MSQSQALVHKWSVQDLIEDKRITPEEITDLRDWLDIQRDLPYLTDEQLAFLHLSCDREDTFTHRTLREYVNAKRWSPNIFNNRDVTNKELANQLNSIRLAVFPKLTEEGYIIVHYRLHDFNFMKFDCELSAKLIAMTLDRILYEYPPAGMIVLIDTKGVGLLHLTRLKINIMKSAFHYLQEALPIKLIAIHVLNTVYFIEKCLAIIKPFVKVEIFDMMYFHPTSMTMKEFQEKFIPKQYLPEDFGGDLPNTNILHEENVKRLLEMKPFFDAEEELRLKTY